MMMSQQIISSSYNTVVAFHLKPNKPEKLKTKPTTYNF